MTALTMSRRKLLKQSLTVAGALAASAGAGAADAPEQPNIVLFLMDDMSCADAGYLGRRYFNTPHIDSLARDGMVFTNAYVPAPECSPTRASLISGQYPARTGVYCVRNPNLPKPGTMPLNFTPTGTEIPRRCIPLSAVLKDAGYATAIFGKWHHGPRPDKTYYKFDEIGVPGEGEGWNRDPARDPKYAFEFTRRGVAFIQKNRDRPFFLYLSHNAPHTPIECRPATLARYADRASIHPKDRPDYAAMMEDADTAIGQMLDALDTLGLRDRTLVILCSDNGGNPQLTSNDPFKASKGRLHEGGIRVPCVARWPGVVAAGARCDTPIMATDFYPTFLDVAGAKPPAGYPLDGESIVPLLRGELALAQRPLFWHLPVYNTFRWPPSGAVRRGDFKLIHFFEDDRLELYNLREDIGEKTDLSATMPEKAREMLDLLQAWRQAAGAVMPTKNPDYRKESQ